MKSLSQEAAIVKYALIVSGLFFFLLLFYVQLSVIVSPYSQSTKEFVIGAGQDWRDGTHLRSALAFAWADWIVLFPLFVLGIIGVVKSRLWGYILWVCTGVLCVYVSVFLWVLEKDYVYPVHGPLAYYTYYWGFFVYWGLGVILFSSLQIVRASRHSEVAVPD